MEGALALNVAIFLANALGFPLLQLGVAWIFVRLPDSLFASHRHARMAAELRFYRNVLRVRAWKRLLPNGGQWVGSNYEHQAALRQGAAGRQRFLLETRRSEATHWTSLLATLVFFPWNPPWARIVMALAGLAFNLPCLIVQRYNRAALS